MEITTLEELQKYLDEAGLRYRSITQLGGGSANFIWRGKDALKRSMIIKHTEPYVASSNGQIPFPTDRMNFEYAALTKLPEHIAKSRMISLPVVYRYDAENCVLTMEDAGEQTMKSCYAHGSISIKTYGKEIGKWLAGLHRDTRDVQIGDNKTGKAIYRYAYANVAAALQQYGHDPALGQRINEQYGSLLASDDECVCHGDFWPGNILTDGLRLKVVDWEMVRRGCGATDVGQFAAEAYLLDKFRGGKGLLKAFLSGYRGEIEPNERLLQRVGVHMGVHLAFWPTRVHWGTEDQTRECVDIGNDLMSRAADNGDGWVKSSPLEPLL